MTFAEFIGLFVCSYSVCFGFGANANCWCKQNGSLYCETSLASNASSYTTVRIVKLPRSIHDRLGSSQRLALTASRSLAQLKQQHAQQRILCAIYSSQTWTVSWSDRQRHSTVHRIRNLHWQTLQPSLWTLKPPSTVNSVIDVCDAIKCPWVVQRHSDLAICSMHLFLLWHTAFDYAEFSNLHWYLFYFIVFTRWNIYDDRFTSENSDMADK